MFPRPTNRAIVFAALAGATVIGVAACGGGDGQSTPSAEPTATATVTATSTSTAKTTATATATATATTGSTGGGSTACEVGSLKITYADDKGGGAAGSVYGRLRFTNTGSASCTLRGFPGVSYVGGGNGTQLGAPATRTDDDVTTQTLAPGKSGVAQLRRTQAGNYGDDCQEAQADGFRVYPPGSTESAFVAFETDACRSTRAPLLEVGPVG